MIKLIVGRYCLSQQQQQEVYGTGSHDQYINKYIYIYIYVCYGKKLANTKSFLSFHVSLGVFLWINI